MGRWPLALLALSAVAATGCLPAAAGQVSPVVGEPVPVSAVFDNSGGFSALAGASDVEVFYMDGRVYGMVAAFSDSGVQIMDVTDPTRPAPVSTIFDGSGGFGSMRGASDVEVFSTGGRTYGMVAAGYGISVQVMDVTDPARPAPVTRIFGGGHSSYSMAGASDMEVFDMDGRTYVMAITRYSDVLKIMDMTDPARPIQMSEIFGGSDGLGDLNDARDLEVFGMDGRTYCIVTAGQDNGVRIIDITDPESPVPISSVFDGSWRSGALKNVDDVEVFGADGRTYAVVTVLATGDGDGRVQIMDITDPARPVPMSTIVDASGRLGSMAWAYDVGMFRMGDRVYATITVAWDGDLVQIMDVTDPANPAPVSAVFDGEGGFTALGGAADMEVYEIGGRTYGMVAAMDDGGVQIMDVTDPANPAPVSAVFDGEGGFTALYGARDVEVFGAGGRTYAMVTAAWYDNAVQIMDVTNPAYPVPVSAIFGDSRTYSTTHGTADANVFVMDGRTYAVVAASYGWGARIMNLTDPARPALISAVFDGSDGFDALGGAYDVKIFGVGGKTYAVVAAEADHGVQVIDVTDPARPIPISAGFDGSGEFDALRRAYDVEVFGMDGRTYAIMTVVADHGVRVVDITDPARPAPVSATFDGSVGFDALRGAYDVEVFGMDRRTYAIVAAAWYDDAVQIIDITDPARPAPVSAAFDGSNGFDALYGAADVEVFDTHGRTYAIVAAMYDNGVQIMDVTDPARPAPVSAAFDGSGGFDALKRASDVEVFGMDGRTYAIVAARDDKGVQIMDVTPPLPHYLDVSVEVTGHERLSSGDGDFVQIAVQVTNHGSATLYNDNQNGTLSSGGLRVSLNALVESHTHTAPPCDAAQYLCTRPNGEYIAYDDITRGQAQSYGVAVSKDDCTARDGWGAPPGETAEATFCYWVDAEFEPESMQFYQADAYRVQSVPFLEYGSCYLPYMLCDESALTPLH